MDEFKEMIAKDVCVFYVSNGDLTLYFSDATMRIWNGNYAWRICKDENILLSSADCCAQVVDSESVAFWPMKNTDDGSIDDFDEYMEKQFEQLEIHAYSKIDLCKELLEGETVTSVKRVKAHDILVSFSNGISLEVFQMINHDMNNSCLCNFFEISPDQFEKEKRIIL